jgi:DNA-directed RNA polymerase subunit RPC12/RpoP
MAVKRVQYACPKCAKRVHAAVMTNTMKCPLCGTIMKPNKTFNRGIGGLAGAQPVSVEGTDFPNSPNAAD